MQRKEGLISLNSTVSLKRQDTMNQSLRHRQPCVLWLATVLRREE